MTCQRLFFSTLLFSFYILLRFSFVLIGNQRFPNLPFQRQSNPFGMVAALMGCCCFLSGQQHPSNSKE